MTKCAIWDCYRSPREGELCSIHLRRQWAREYVGLGAERVEMPWCECIAPLWAGCGPFFPGVRYCRRCGSPDVEQFGLSDGVTTADPPPPNTIGGAVVPRPLSSEPTRRGRVRIKSSRSRG